MKKACFLTAAIALMTLPANANGYDYLTFEDNSGQLTSMTVTNLKITIADNNLVVTNADGTLQFPISSMAKMFFAETSGVGELPATDGGEVVAYTTAGVRVGKFKDIETARRSLDKGICLVFLLLSTCCLRLFYFLTILIYLFKTQGKTLKTVLDK